MWSLCSCDRSFSLIEQKLTSKNFIRCPQVYREYIARTIGKENPVVAMQRVDFLEVFKLRDLIKVHLAAAKGFSKACHLVVDASYKEGCIIKNSCDYEDVNSKLTRVQVMPGKGPNTSATFNFGTIQLAPKFAGERLLQPEKLKDVVSLRKLLDLKGVRWLDNLVQRQAHLWSEGSDVLQDEEAMDDPDNPNWEYEPVRRCGRHTTS